MVSRTAPLVVRRSLPVRVHFVPVYLKSECRVLKKASLRKDPTLAELLKNHVYMTAQYGKNHLNDLDKMLPANHGFDEFMGNLYNLNAKEEPENGDYPKISEFKKKYGPRDVIKSTADGNIVDTGLLTRKRMENIDDEITVGALDFMEQRAPGFAVWQEPLVTLRVPKLIDMRSDPYERAEQEAEMYNM
jgi:arylsulfatase A-like enzyme